jgi:phosphatidyl-myo-inositol alpha-mannosyltransferase
VRVAITHPYSWPEVRRGAERISVETARALAARGHDVTVITSGTRSGRATGDGFATVRYRRVFTNAARHERWFAWRIMPRLLAGRYDVVHSLMPWDAWAALRTGSVAKHRTVYEELGIPIRDWWADKPDRRPRLEVAQRIDVYGCMSEYALGVLDRDFGRAGALIPGGVRTGEFGPAPDRERRPTILFSGALDEPRKGVNLLLQALPLVAAAHPDVQLWLSGAGDVTPLLDGLPAETMSRTTALGVGDPHAQADRYGRAWVTALPSVNESFGMVLIESLACGTPIVVADDSAPPELARPGVGAVCAPGDVRSLADALLAGLALAQDPATAARCREVAARYDWDEAIAPALEAIYRPGNGMRD